MSKRVTIHRLHRLHRFELPKAHVRPIARTTDRGAGCEEGSREARGNLCNLCNLWIVNREQESLAHHPHHR